jgi:hypothetical protein
LPAIIVAEKLHSEESAVVCHCVVKNADNAAWLPVPSKVREEMGKLRCNTSCIAIQFGKGTHEKFYLDVRESMTTSCVRLDERTKLLKER